MSIDWATTLESGWPDDVSPYLWIDKTVAASSSLRSSRRHR
jgi:hypothetical protein